MPVDDFFDLLWRVIDTPGHPTSAAALERLHADTRVRRLPTVVANATGFDAVWLARSQRLCRTEPWRFEFWRGRIIPRAGE